MKTRNLCYLFILMALLFPACSEAPSGGDTSLGEQTMSPQTPEEVVALFCESFFDAAPPRWDNEAAKTAYMLLSASSQRELNGIRAGLSGRLTMFAGVGDVPDHGYHIRGVLSETEEEALVETCWHYGSEDEDSTTTIKVFALALQEGMWRIDEIQKR